MILSGRRVARLAVAFIWLLVVILYALPSRGAFAAQLTNRSLTLQAGATDGGSKPGGVVKHLFTFDIASSSSMGSIQFLYCTTAAGSCTTPNGLSTTSATLGAQTGPATGFTLVNTTNGAPYITRTASTVTTGTASTFRLDTVTNPDNTNCGNNPPATNNCSFYVRITTYASTNVTGSPIDDGTVAASTATQIVLTGTMPESLIFCTGHTISLNGGGIPDCSTADSGSISFNLLFSPADTATASSQLAASTNADFGYVITVNGTTLTSGSNTITAMTTTGTGDLGVRGTRQFGMNLRANTTTTSTPAVGTDVAPAANGTNYKGEALTGYASIDHFRFVSGDSVADSANGGAGPTDTQLYTATYMVNVSGGQPTGTYTSTLTYICTATF